MINYREVGIFDLLSAPLNPIGAFDAEQFKKDTRLLMNEKPKDFFVAVDLMGLDFVYSDAYNAFLQYQQELSNKGGLLVLLTNSATIIDGLKKAGLDRKLKVFASEADLMSYSLGTHNEEQAEQTERTSVKAVASQNGKATSIREDIASVSIERKSSGTRRFTKSFNAIVKDEKKLSKKGISLPFDEEKSSAPIIVIVLAVIVLIGAIAAYLFA